MEKNDYQQTLQLPKTDFPMRANLPQREPEMLKYWEEKQFYQKLQADGKERDLPIFILHDGPPYANGHIHIGTALNKILKDLVIRSRSMDGYHAPYLPGWDTHGLPIELQAIRDLGVDQERISELELRQKCREYALKYLDIQRDEFKRLGVWGDWENPYLTLNPEYEAKQIEIFGKMASKGFIYKALKPVYWCMDCKTALAEAEIEYYDHRSPSIYVRFAVTDGKGILSETDTYFVIWTTTPWTIPANLAICLNPTLTYVNVKTNLGHLVVAKGLLESFAVEVGLDEYEIVQEFVGAELEGIVCKHPLIDRDSPIILGDHATLEAGTGCVHTAPGHGLEDYQVGLKYNLPILAPVDEHGVFTEEALQYAGLKITDSNKIIVQDLEACGALLKLDFVTHSYPHCWRCKDPVFFRATEQWFASISGFRQAMLNAINQVEWIPQWGIDRIRNMVAERGDWCISRQRVWGVPIPLFYCDQCEQAIIDRTITDHVAALFRVEGSDAWWKREAKDLLPDGFRCPHCGGAEFTKETDIMDVWFDSGVSHASVLQQRDEMRWPADMYLEGSDQHRGWFQSSLSTSVAAFDQAPYKSVLTHGFVVDGEGRKMSKSLGNVIGPAEVIKKFGADILRMWVASAEYRGDIRVSQEILQQLADAYRRIRNTARFIIGNLNDFDPEQDLVAYEDLCEIDQWALDQLVLLSERVRNAYRRYEFHIVYHSVHHFCAVDLGGFYLDVLKDRLYCDPPAGHKRCSAQTAMYHILMELVQLLAPILVFTADEIWQYMPKPASTAESVHLSRWQQLPRQFANPQIRSKWSTLLEVRRQAAKALEDARAEKKMGSSNEAQITVIGDQNTIEQLKDISESLAMLFIVSNVDLVVADEPGITVQVELADTEKCDRCWRHDPSVGEHEAHHICNRCYEVITSSSAV
ncbi:MAG TPA: isoleucine--tRNA ligase [Firmicutes bacterium]|nr:isoleucine--tRNA ligase [Bacillota bacterium]